MITQRKLISSVYPFGNQRNQYSSPKPQNIAKHSILSISENSPIERKYNNRFHSSIIPTPTPHKQNTVSSAATAPITSNAIGINSVQTLRIDQAFSQLRSSIVARGRQYINNGVAQRRGYVAENFVAESYNVDATIKKISDRATVPESNKNASPDIIYDHGKKQASLKFYQDADSSAKAQTNPQYGEQARIVPSDQVTGGKAKLENLAKRNEAKGRSEAANIQRDTANRLDSVITGSDGAQSTPLSLENADEMSKSFIVDQHGEKTVNHARIDKAIEKTGLTQKVERAKMLNELRGIGIAAAIGLGTGFAIGFIVTLAENGINPESLKYAFVSGAKQGGAGAAISTIGAALGMTVGTTVGGTIASQIITSLGTNVTQTTVERIYSACNSGVVGIITILAFSTYEFTKLKLKGYGSKESLLRTGKTAALSLSILVISTAAIGIWGNVAGITISIASTVIMTGYSVYKTHHDKHELRKITFYSVELCRPTLLTV